MCFNQRKIAKYLHLLSWVLPWPLLLLGSSLRPFTSDLRTRLLFLIWLPTRPSHHFYFYTIWSTSFLFYSGSSSTSNNNKKGFGFWRNLESKGKRVKERLEVSKEKGENLEELQLFWSWRMESELPASPLWAALTLWAPREPCRGHESALAPCSAFKSQQNRKKAEQEWTEVTLGRVTPQPSLSCTSLVAVCPPAGHFSEIMGKI